jgi:hypothetical protein
VTTLDLSTLDDQPTPADGVYVGVLRDRATGQVGLMLNETAALALAAWIEHTDPAPHDLVSDLGIWPATADDLSALITTLRAQLLRH